MGEVVQKLHSQGRRWRDWGEFVKYANDVSSPPLSSSLSSRLLQKPKAVWTKSKMLTALNNVRCPQCLYLSFLFLSSETPDCLQHINSEHQMWHAVRNIFLFCFYFKKEPSCDCASLSLQTFDVILHKKSSCAQRVMHCSSLIRFWTKPPDCQ